MRILLRGVLALAVVVNLLVAGTAVGLRTGDADLVVGQPPPAVQAPLPGPTVPPPPVAPAPVRAATAEAAPRGRALGERPEPAGSRELRTPDAVQYGPAVPFRSSEPVPGDLLFVLVIGSDARPGEPLDRSRADSIHLLAMNPSAGTGTVLGFPRDAWVEIPGHGNGKINSALALGGPDLLSATVQRLTGLPVHWWALTGFDGLRSMVDELGRLVVPVQRRMADRGSGAFFERGFHNLSGGEVLAFSRDRHSVARGDFSRSENQGTVLLQALRKLRVDVGDVAGVRRWTEVLWRHARLDAPFDDAVRLGSVARRIDPDALVNVVASGGVGTVRGASVVFLDEQATALFQDLRADATIGTAPPPTTTTTMSSTTTTTAPTRLLR